MDGERTHAPNYTCICSDPGLGDERLISSCLVGEFFFLNLATNFVCI